MNKNKSNTLIIGGRPVGPDYPPFIIAEIGINHGGDFSRAKRMIDDAYKAGCECVKFQTHIIEDEMIPNGIVPGNSDQSIWDIISRCVLSEDEEEQLKDYAQKKGLIYLSTPFSRAAVERLEKMNICAYKIGSGECNNYPLIEIIASKRKPVILSTGMNDVRTIRPAVSILRRYKIKFALLHCVSIYPTPYTKMNLGALSVLNKSFPDAVLGISDHSMSIYPSLAAVALGSSIIERHFTSSKRWSGPDIPISMDRKELQELIIASRIIHQALGADKRILEEEGPTIRFAYSSVVALRDIAKGEKFSYDNIWLKRPGTGQLKAKDFKYILGKRSKLDIKKNAQIRRGWYHE